MYWGQYVPHPAPRFWQPGGLGLAPMDDEYLAHVQYPATKVDVIASAEREGAPQETIEALQRADAESFASVEEVRQAVLRQG